MVYIYTRYFKSSYIIGCLKHPKPRPFFSKSDYTNFLYHLSTGWIHSPTSFHKLRFSTLLHFFQLLSFGLPWFYHPSGCMRHCKKNSFHSWCSIRRPSPVAKSPTVSSRRYCLHLWATFYSNSVINLWRWAVSNMLVSVWYFSRNREISLTLSSNTIPLMYWNI